MVQSNEMVRIFTLLGRYVWRKFLMEMLQRGMRTGVTGYGRNEIVVEITEEDTTFGNGA